MEDVLDGTRGREFSTRRQEVLSHLLKRQDVEETRRVFDLVQLVGCEGLQSGCLGAKLAVWDDAEVDRQRWGLREGE